MCKQFLGFINIPKQQNSDTVVTALQQFINTLDLSQIPIIGLSYDRVAVLSGSECGVQIKLRQNHLPASAAIYIHSMTHELNLVIVNICKRVKVKIVYI